MILKEAGKEHYYGERRDKVRFAFIPTLLKRNITDTKGEIIWFEKYVIHERYADGDWVVHSSERLSVAALHKFENEDCEEEIKADTADLASPGAGYGRNSTGISGSTTSPISSLVTIKKIVRRQLS